MQFLQIACSHIFHAHQCTDPHFVRAHPSETALHIPPCGTCVKILIGHMKFPPHFKTVRHSHSEAYHAWPHKKGFQHHPFAHIFGPCI